MSAAAPLAAVSVLLACVAAWELAGARPREQGLRQLEWLPGGSRAAAAALRLGLPRRISRAGLSGRIPLSAVLTAKLACAACGGLVALLALPAAPGRTGLMVALGMPVAGFLVPDALLERAARRRHRRLVAALPDALELLSVGAATGRGPARGFAELAAAGEGPLAVELGIAAAEVDCGVSLGDAMQSLRERVPGTELAAICTSIERSGRLGSPLADQLRRQAGALRRDQRRAVEERAARAAPKIQLVVALALVPSVLLMIVAGLIANADRLLGGF